MSRKFKRIETDRLVIDYGTVDDYIKVHEYDFNDLQNMKGITKLTKNNPDDVRKWFGDSIDNWYDSIEAIKHYNMIVFLKENKEPIADIGFDRNDETNNSIELSCWLHPNYWGRGYMEEALIPIMNFIYNEGFDNIVSGYVEGNDRSKRMHEKLGFVPYKVNSGFYTNYGQMKEYDNILSKERYNELYKGKIK